MIAETRGLFFHHLRMIGASMRPRSDDRGNMVRDSIFRTGLELGRDQMIAETRWGRSKTRRSFGFNEAAIR